MSYPTIPRPVLVDAVRRACHTAALTEEQAERLLGVAGDPSVHLIARGDFYVQPPLGEFVGCPLTRAGFYRPDYGMDTDQIDAWNAWQFVYEFDRITKQALDLPFGSHPKIMEVTG